MIYFIYNYLKNNFLKVLRVGAHETFKALSDPVRRDILIMLKGNKLSKGDGI